MPKNQLTDKQMAFVEEYVRTGNGVQSYKSAFNSKSDGAAKVESFRLLRMTKIVEKIGELECSYGQLARENELSKAQIILQLKKIIYGNDVRATLSAINTVNRLCGWLTPPKQMVEVEDDKNTIDFAKLSDEELAKQKAYYMPSL
ncbi:MAG: terminase small subunit [bacterium]